MSPAPSTSIRAAYNAFLSTEGGAILYEHFKKILYGPQDSLTSGIQDLVAEHLTEHRGRELRVCDVGGGDGKRVKRILRFLHDRLELKFCLDLVDQSPEMLARRDGDDPIVLNRSRTLCGMFEELELRNDYDLVFLIHSIFAFREEASLKRVLGLLRNDGLLVAVTNASNSFLGGLKKIVDQGYLDSRFEIDDLRRIFEAHNVKFAEEMFETRWRIPRERFAEDVGTILTWISLGGIHAFSEAQKMEIGRYIESNAVEENGGYVFVEKEIVILVGPASA